MMNIVKETTNVLKVLLIKIKMARRNDKYHQGDNHKDALERDCQHLIFIVEGIGPLHCIVVDYQTLLPFARTQT